MKCNAVMAARVDKLDHEWRTVAVGASRWYVHKLRQRYRTAEFEAFPIADGIYRIEARRR